MNTPSPSFDGLPKPRRHWSLAVVWLTVVMAVLDSAIANIALPTIARELRASPVTAVGTINAYQIAIIMLLLPFAAAGEIFGYRRVYLCGIGLFVAASLGCAAAPGLDTLVAARFAQGIGSAAIMALNSALIRATVPSDRLGRTIGYNAVVVSLSSAAGPSVAAAILSIASWRWLFAVNVPIGLAALLIGLRALPISERSPRPFDWRASVVNALMFGALFFVSTTLVNGTAGAITFLSALVAFVAALMLFRHARRQADPLIPIDLLRVPLLRASYIASVSAFAGQMTGLVALPFYLQAHFDRLTTGLLITSFPLGVALAAPLSGRLSDRLSTGRLGFVGLSALATGYGLVTLTGGVGLVAIVGCLGLAGFGMGLFQAPNNRVMVGEAPRRRSGAAAGMLAICRLSGQTLGALTAAMTFRLFGSSSWVPFVIAGCFALIGAMASATRRPAVP